MSKFALPVASADHGVVRAVDARLRQAAITAITLGVMCTATAPGPLLANWLTEPQSAVTEVQGLREKADRRRALIQELEAQVVSLDAEVANLKLERAEHEAKFIETRERLGTLERTLDHLVPRLLAREAVIEARRQRATLALAKLADLSRETDIAPEMRARLLAVSPVMLDRLWGAEASTAKLRDDARERAAEHRKLMAEAPALLEARQRTEVLREQAQRRLGAIENRLPGLRTEFARLRAEQRELAEQLVAHEAAMQARAEPQSDEPTRIGTIPTELPEAEIKGHIAIDAAIADVLGSTRIVVAQKGRVKGPSLTLTAEAGGSFMIGPPPAKPLDLPVTASVPAGIGTILPAAAEAAPVPRAQLSSIVSTAPLNVRRASTLPVPGNVIAGADVRIVRDEQYPSLVIKARPGQVVAAPDHGRVVFAGRFKRYGLLLMIEHAPDYHTLLWGFADLQVQRGDWVDAGQAVGGLGAPEGIAPSLHMEVRRNGKPVNPMLWMAASDSKVQG